MDVKVRKKPSEEKFFYFIIASALAAHKISSNVHQNSRSHQIESLWKWNETWRIFIISQSSLKFELMSNKKIFDNFYFYERKKSISIKRCYSPLRFLSISWIFLRRAYFSIKEINYAHNIRIFSNYCWCWMSFQYSNALHMFEFLKFIWWVNILGLCINGDLFDLQKSVFREVFLDSNKEDKNYEFFIKSWYLNWIFSIWILAFAEK